MTTKNIIYLFTALLITVTLLFVLSNYFTYKNALTAYEDSMKLHALGIALTLEPTLSDILNRERNIFAEIIKEGRWEGIAYIALYTSEGLTIKHSNENLINKKIDDDLIKKALKSGEPVNGYLILGTGENVFVLNLPTFVEKSHVVLRVALHRYPFENILRQARFQALSSAVVVIILWITGFFFIKALKQSEALSKAIEERQRLALLGEISSRLAHEIRNPLGSIKGFAQLILEEIKKLTSHSQDLEEYSKIIIKEAKRLESLTDDLLQYSRIKESKPETFDLKDLILECVNNIKANINLKKVDFRLSNIDSLFIETDYNKLKQVLINLIYNSIESIDERGFVEINYSQKNRLVEISISDNGCGMDEETLKNAFRPFFTTKAQGTGLGLAIVENLLKAIGGTIKLQSKAKEGTTVKITIPKNL
ncbi:MAG: ATP-binding protein [Thermodesulfovibrionales bacterium]|nr:ATP-binding protein [Thermodesulfovibrionales bacterium]